MGDMDLFVQVSLLFLGKHEEFVCFRCPNEATLNLISLLIINNQGERKIMYSLRSVVVVMGDGDESPSLSFAKNFALK